MTKPICVFDVETDGTEPGLHEVVECSWWVLETGQRETFIPPHSLAHSQADALAVNDYSARGLWETSRWDEDGSALRRFYVAATGCRLVGSNPGFDVAFLKPLFVRFGVPVDLFAYPPLDLGAYAAGVLNRPIGDRVGLKQLCSILGVEAPTHTAEGDVSATMQCLMELQRIANFQRTAS